MFKSKTKSVMDTVSLYSNYLIIHPYVIDEDGNKVVRFNENHHQVYHRDKWYEVINYDFVEIGNGKEATNYIKEYVSEIDAYIFENDFIEDWDYYGDTVFRKYFKNGQNVYLTSDIFSPEDINYLTKKYKDNVEIKQVDDLDYYFFHFKSEKVIKIKKAKEKKRIILPEIKEDIFDSDSIEKMIRSDVNEVVRKYVWGEWLDEQAIKKGSREKVDKALNNKNHRIHIDMIDTFDDYLHAILLKVVANHLNDIPSNNIVIEVGKETQEGYRYFIIDLHDESRYNRFFFIKSEDDSYYAYFPISEMKDIDGIDEALEKLKEAQTSRDTREQFVLNKE